MIEAKQLTKHFGQKVAVDGISFTVHQHDVLGFLGPNAAGKSTTMRMLTGFLPPTSGTALIGGEDIIESSLAARSKIGYLPENAPVYPDMTVIGFLDFIAHIRGLSGPEKKKRVEETLRRCFLSEVRFQMINTLSKGFKQRVCFAQSILHDPEYLIMDEPTDGLDPNQKHEVRGMIRQMAKNKTIVLSTHNLEEVDAVCTRVIIIANGKIVVDDTPQRLKARSSVHGAVCVALQSISSKDLVPHLEAMPGVQHVSVVEEGDSNLTLRVYPRDPMDPIADRIIRHLAEKQIRVDSVIVEEGRLDEVFRMVTTSGSGGQGK